MEDDNAENNKRARLSFSPAKKKAIKCLIHDDRYDNKVEKLRNFTVKSLEKVKNARLVH